MELVDNQLANQFTATFQPLFNLSSILVVVTLAVPLFPVLFLPVLYFCECRYFLDFCVLLSVFMARC
eukprot:SAG22_NODE_44_length_24912_cov_33.648894_22_plen_67_part_00